MIFQTTLKITLVQRRSVARTIDSRMVSTSERVSIQEGGNCSMNAAGKPYEFFAFSFLTLISNRSTYTIKGLPLGLLQCSDGGRIDGWWRRRWVEHCIPRRSGVYRRSGRKPEWKSQQKLKRRCWCTFNSNRGFRNGDPAE